MKTAISIPDSLFKAAENYAKRVDKSRSQLFAEAMAEYLERHSPSEVTRTLNETLATINQFDSAFIEKASHTILEQSEW